MFSTSLIRRGLARACPARLRQAEPGRQPNGRLAAVLSASKQAAVEAIAGPDAGTGRASRRQQSRCPKPDRSGRGGPGRPWCRPWPPVPGSARSSGAGAGDVNADRISPPGLAGIDGGAGYRVPIRRVSRRIRPLSARRDADSGDDVTAVCGSVSSAAEPQALRSWCAPTRRRRVTVRGMRIAGRTRRRPWERSGRLAPRSHGDRCTAVTREPAHRLANQALTSVINFPGDCAVQYRRSATA